MCSSDLSCCRWSCCTAFCGSRAPASAPGACVRVCVCVCARARVRACACVCLSFRTRCAAAGVAAGCLGAPHALPCYPLPSPLFPPRIPPLPPPPYPSPLRSLTPTASRVPAAHGSRQRPLLLQLRERESERGRGREGEGGRERGRWRGRQREGEGDGGREGVGETERKSACLRDCQPRFAERARGRGERGEESERGRERDI